MSCIMSRKTVLLLLLLIIWIITNFLVAHFCTKNIHIKQGDRIAVVGNGPSVKSEKCGTYIDNHDVVIRFNSAPIIPEYTGEKTSIHVITAGSDKSFIKGAQKVMIMNSSLFKYFRPQFHILKNLKLLAFKLNQNQIMKLLYMKYSAFQMKLLMKVQNLLHYLSIVED